MTQKWDPPQIGETIRRPILDAFADEVIAKLKQQAEAAWEKVRVAEAVAEEQYALGKARGLEAAAAVINETLTRPVPGS